MGPSGCNRNSARRIPRLWLNKDVANAEGGHLAPGGLDLVARCDDQNVLLCEQGQNPSNRRAQQRLSAREVQ
jgi:hypothetical protein